ncbi:hypothetical protein Dimus_028528 [Dionaea muscipula]
MKQSQLIVNGEVDPVEVVSKLRKQWQMDIVMIGPAKEKEEGKEKEGKQGGSGVGKKEGDKNPTMQLAHKKEVESSVKQDMEALGREESLSGKGAETYTYQDIEHRRPSVDRTTENERWKRRDSLAEGGTSFKVESHQIVAGRDDVMAVSEIEPDVESVRKEAHGIHVSDSSADSERPSQSESASAAFRADGQAMQSDMVAHFRVNSDTLSDNETDDSSSSVTAGQYQNKLLSSIDCTMQQILDVLKDAQVRKIGLFGRGGIGKTSILKALGSHPEIKRLFNLVIWVAVPRYSYRSKIQGQILQQLSLSVDSNSADDKDTKPLEGQEVSFAFG